MLRSQVLYEVCGSSTECQFEAIGGMFEDRTEAETELRRIRRRYPEAFLARVVYTRFNKTVPCRRVRAV